jgi:hypothetical protein
VLEESKQVPSVRNIPMLNARNVQDMDTWGNVSSRDTLCQVEKEIDAKDSN